MNNNLMLLGLLAAAFLFLRRPGSSSLAGYFPTGVPGANPVGDPFRGGGVAGQMENPLPGIPGTTGMYGEG